MADKAILRQDPKSTPIERDNLRKIQNILNALADNVSSVQGSTSATSGVSALKKEIAALTSDFTEHKQDMNNIDHKVTHKQSMAADALTGDTNTDHDDRLYPQDMDGSDPTTNVKLFLREDVVGLSSGAVDVEASGISTDTTNFDNNLSSADDTVQKALETLDEVSGGGGGGDFLYVTMSADQTSGLATGDTILMDTESAKIGTGISIDTNTYTITCAAGSSYEIMFSQRAYFSDVFGVIDLQLYDVTNSALVGQSMSSAPYTYTGLWSSTGPGLYVVTLEQDTDYQLRVRFSRDCAHIGADYTYLTVREL